jgi:hypothetical protein
VRSTTGPATPITRSGHADQPPCAVPHRLCGDGAAGVHETGRRSGAHGSVPTDSPIRRGQHPLHRPDL